jgi:hypothetical protein
MAAAASIPAWESCDDSLLAAIRSRIAPPSLADLTAKALRELSASEGIEAATALLYDRVRTSPRHSGFIARIEELLQRPRPPTPLPETLIGIVPAAFYRQMPRTGADGRVVRETAARLGLPCELVPLRSAGTLAENSAQLCQWLTQHREKRIILVSLCKGGADVKYALHSPEGPRCFRPVVAWINICGTLDGSPFAQWLLTTKPRFIAAWVYFKCSGRNFRLLQEIVPSPNGPLAAPLKLPDTLRLVSLVGFPLRRHLSNGFMRRCHGFIAPQGPNDGGVLLADACRTPGLLYPVWGADHYLRPDARAAAILAAVFTHLLADSPTSNPVDAVAAGAGT